MIQEIRNSLIGLSAFLLTGCFSFNPPSEKPLSDSTAVEPQPRIQDESSHRDQEYLYDLAAVPEICLTFTEEDWNTYLDNYDANKDNTIYVPAAS